MCGYVYGYVCLFRTCVVCVRCMCVFCTDMQQGFLSLSVAFSVLPLSPRPCTFCLAHVLSFACSLSSYHFPSSPLLPSYFLRFCLHLWTSQDAMRYHYIVTPWMDWTLLRQSHTFKASFVNEACLCHPIHPYPAILLVLFWTPCCDSYEKSTICRLDASVNSFAREPCKHRGFTDKEILELESSHYVAATICRGRKMAGFKLKVWHSCYPYF